jgi:hypothetical protein
MLDTLVVQGSTLAIWSFSPVGASAVLRQTSSAPWRGVEDRDERSAELQVMGRVHPMLAITDASKDVAWSYVCILAVRKRNC